MNQPPLPSGATARIVPLTSGKPAAGSSLDWLSFTPWPVRGPTKVNVPPRYVRPAESNATALTWPFVTCPSSSASSLDS
jgi:hypothetical protein